MEVLINRCIDDSESAAPYLDKVFGEIACAGSEARV